MARPNIQRKPDRLLRRKIRMATPGPEPREDKPTVQIIAREDVLVSLWHARGLLVGLFGRLEVPLLLVGEEFQYYEKYGDAGESEVVESELGGRGKRVEQEEDVAWRGDGEEEEGLREGDEDDVEQEE